MKYRKITTVILIVFSLILVSPIVQHIINGFTNPFFKNLGLTRDSMAPWYIWLFTFIISFTYILFTFKSVPLVYKMQREISFFKLVGLFSGLVAGIIEELAFRRWFMDLIMHQGIGIVPQIIFSGLVFGIAHVSWSLFGHKKKIGIGAAIATTLLGVSLAIVYIIGQRNIGPCIVAHCLISMILEPWIMLAAVSGQWKSVESKE